MEFDFKDPQLTTCQSVFNSLKPEERVFMDCYELCQQTGIDSQLWKAFLMDKRVSNWVNEEVALFKQSQYRKLVRDATTDKRSVGAPQMINALGKSLENDESKEGDMFVYCYTPLNVREQHAPNVTPQPYDIFEGDV